MRNQNLTKLADLIREQRQQLIQMWRGKVHQAAMLRNLDTPAACSHRSIAGRYRNIWIRRLKPYDQGED